MRKKQSDIKKEFFSTTETPEAKEIREERQKMVLSSKMVNAKKNKYVLISMNNCEITVIEFDSEGKPKEKARQPTRWDVCLWIYCRWKREYYSKGYYEDEPEVVDTPRKKRKKKEVIDDD